MKTCSHPDCTNPVFSKGKCRWHMEKKAIKGRVKKWIAPISAKQADRLAEYRRVRDFYMADHPVCEGKIAGCTITPTDLHHAFGKIGSLLTDTRYFKALCRHCHDWVHNNVTEARERGLLGKSTEGFIINKKG